MKNEKEYYVVSGTRKDKGVIYKVYFSLRDKNGAPEFLSDFDLAIHYTRTKAIACVNYLKAENDMGDGLIEKEQCRLGSNAVSNIGYEKIQLPVCV